MHAADSAHPIAQCLGVPRQVVLCLDEQFAVLVLGIVEHGVDVPRGGGSRRRKLSAKKMPRVSGAKCDRGTSDDRICGTIDK